MRQATQQNGANAPDQTGGSGALDCARLIRISSERGSPGHGGSFSPPGPPPAHPDWHRGRRHQQHPRPRREPDGWIIEPEYGPVERLQGPYRANGAWWVREVERDYYFAHTRSGDVLWVFYDRPRRTWFLHGWLE